MNTTICKWCFKPIEDDFVRIEGDLLHKKCADEKEYLDNRQKEKSLLEKKCLDK